MAHDDKHTIRPAQPVPPRQPEPPISKQPEPGGWEAKQQAGAGWERRNAHTERLREGRNHPLHHGRSLHGSHAHDGEGRTDDRIEATPRPTRG